MEEFDEFDPDDLDLDELDAGWDAGELETDLPDPIDGPDAADITFGGTAISGGSAVDAVAEGDLIIAADGTGYPDYSSYVGGTNAHERLDG